MDILLSKEKERDDFSTQRMETRRQCISSLKKRRKNDSAILTTWKYHSEMKAKKAFSDKYKMREFTVSRLSLKEIPKKSA